MLRLSLLGGFEARVDDGHPIVFPRRKAQALLAYLVLNPGRTHPRAKVASLLWSDIAEEAARTNLRQTLGAIRRALPSAAQPVVADPESVGLDRSVVGVDVWELERLANEATPAVYGRVDDLYRGALLAGLGPQSPEFEAWLRGERERVREVAVNVLRRLLAHQTSANDPDAVVATGLRLLDIDPLQEPVYRTLMRVQAAAGRRAAALRQYQVCVSVLQRELGTEPEPETKHLYQEILQRRVPSPTMRGSSGRRDSKPDLATDAHVLVGRDAEARLLRRAIGDVAARDGRVAVLVGEAGIGKSALLAAVADEAHAAGSLVVVGRCHESQQVLQFGPWVDALRAAIDDDDRVCSDLDAAWRAELARLLPQVSAPGLPKASNDLLRLFHSVWHLVERLAQRQPLALLLEDVHWADESSARLLAFVARRIRRRAVLLVVTAREEDIPSVPIVQRVLDELRSEPHVALLPVPPLSRADTAALIRHLLGTGAEAATVDRLREQVWKASAGNPFMVVETLRALQEGAVPTTISGLPLPDRVRQVVAARLARLGERTRTLVSVAAAIGREFDFRVLQHAADITERDAAEGVEELVRRRILRPVGDVFDFVHERIRDVAYGQLLPPQRRVLHAAVGRAIEDVHAGDLDAHLVALGAHYREGEVWDKAVEFLRRAGAQMIGRSAHRDAVSVYEQARAALARLPKTDAALATALELSFDLRTALQGLAAFDRILEELQEAERLARAIGDDRRLGQVFVYLTNHHYWTGALDRAVDYGEQALAIGVALDDFAIRVVAAQYLGLAHHARGDYRRGRELLEPAVGALTGAAARERFGQASLPAVSSRHILALCLAELGEFAEAARHCEDGLRLAQAADHPISLLFAYATVGTIELMKGDIDRAVVALERGRRLLGDTALPFHVSIVGAPTARAYAAAGRIAEAIALGEEAIEQAVRIGLMAGQARRLTWLGEVYLAARRREDAARAGERALTLAREQGARGDEAWSHALLGELGARGDDQSAAHDRSAVALARDLGMDALLTRRRRRLEAR